MLVEPETPGGEPAVITTTSPRSQRPYSSSSSSTCSTIASTDSREVTSVRMPTAPPPIDPAVSLAVTSLMSVTTTVAAGERVREARRRMTPGPALVGVASVVAFVAIGAWIFHNTHVLNRYVDSKDQLDIQADYEKNYSRYKDLAQPRIAALRADVDIHPDTRIAHVRGTYRLVNRHAEPISELFVGVGAGLGQSGVELTLPPHTVIERDELARIHEVVRAHDGLTLVDEIYLGLSYEERFGQSALALGERARAGVALFYLLALVLWGTAIWAVRAEPLALAALAPVALHLSWQVAALRQEDGADALAKFRSNRFAGLLMFLACLVVGASV